METVDTSQEAILRGVMKTIMTREGQYYDYAKLKTTELTYVELQCYVRPLLERNLDHAIEHGKRAKKRQAAGQLDIFAATGLDRESDYLTDGVVPWDLHDLLVHEKKSTGVYLSGHPLDPYRDTLRGLGLSTIQALKEEGKERWADIGAVLTEVEYKQTKAGGRFLLGKMQDYTGEIKVICWPKSLAEFDAKLQPDRVAIVTGRLEFEDADEHGNPGEGTIFINKVIGL